MRLLDKLLEEAIGYFPAFRLSIAIDDFKSPYCGMYNLDLIETAQGEHIPYHWIRIDTSRHFSEKDIFDSVMHELIHAWQYENGLPLEHDAIFCEWCLKFQTLGFNTYSTDCHTDSINEAMENLLQKSRNYFKMAA